MGSERARRATSWQIIDLPWDLEVQYDIDPPGDEAEEPEIRLFIGVPEFLQLTMTPDVAEEMIFALQRALEKSAATGPPAGE